MSCSIKLKNGVESCNVKKRNIDPLLRSRIIDEIESKKNKMKLNPCRKCIEKIRKSIFELKSTPEGMISFDTSKTIIESDLKSEKRQMDDLYFINIDITNNNIEHIVPASVSGKREYLNSFDGSGKLINNNFYVNYEPYSDLHFLFSTDKCINDLRHSFVYGNVVKTKEQILILNDKVNADEYILCIQKNNNFINMYYPQDGTELIKNKHFNTHCYDDIDEKEINNMIKIYNKNSLTNCQKCLFEPPDITKGIIARLLFFFYLMYAYDVSNRPIVLEGMIKNVWLGYVKKVTNDRHKLQNAFNKGINMIESIGFNYDEWILFFENHIDDYYEWHNNFEISEAEKIRNKYIIKKTNVPNVFVGYMDHENNYQDAPINLLDHLIFSIGDCTNCNINIKSNTKLCPTKYDPYLGVLATLKELNIQDININPNDQSIVDTLSKINHPIIPYYETVFNIIKECDEIINRAAFNDDDKINIIIQNLNLLKNYNDINSINSLCSFLYIIYTKNKKYFQSFTQYPQIIKYVNSQPNKLLKIETLCETLSSFDSSITELECTLNTLKNDKSYEIYQLLGNDKYEMSKSILNNIIIKNSKKDQNYSGGYYKVYHLSKKRYNKLSLYNDFL